MTTQPRWQRPHPLTVVVLVVTFITGNAGPLIVAFAFGGGGLGFDTVALVVGTVTVGIGALGWFMTGYAVTDEAVHYRSGILNRQSRSISLSRIQQVSIAEPVVARSVGLAIVQVSEASADGDIEVRYLGKSDATELTQRLRNLSRVRRVGPDQDGGSESSLPPPPEPPAVELHSTSIGRIVAYTLASAAPGLALLVLLLGVGVVVIALGWGLGGALLTAVTGMGFVVLLAMLGVLTNVLANGGFRLRRSPRSLTIESGLLSRRQIEVRPERIQTITVSSGPVVRRFDLQQISFSAATGKAANQNASIVQLSPAASTAEVAKIVQGSVDVDPAFDVDLEQVSVLTVRRQLVRSTMAFALVVLPGSVALWFVHPVVAFVPTLLWWPLAFWYARERHRRFGIAIDERRLVIRRGVLHHQLTQVPLSHVQSVTTQTSYFQRRLRLSSLTVSTAGIGPGNHVSIPDLPAQRCRDIELQLAATAAATRWELRT